MKDFLNIVRRNFISPIVIAILVLAIILLILDDARDAWFISVVIIINTLIAIVQEVRAQRALKKLELMSAPKARRIDNDGNAREVTFEELRLGDTIELRIGDEIPADGKLMKSSGLEVDESILTGESVPVEKNNHAMVWGASAVVAGSATMKITAIGAESKIGMMSATLKRYVPQLTPLQKAIWRAITWLTYGAVILAIAIFVVYYLAGQNAIEIVTTIVSAAVTIVPEGLLLASSLLLAFGSLRLARAKVLPQKLAAIEAMALLEVLCVDKTGTLTSDKITFEKLELFDKSKDHIEELVSINARETSQGNATGGAMIAGLTAPNEYKLLETLAFSSSRKMSGVKIQYGQKTFSVIVGAPEYLSEISPLTKSQQSRVEKLVNEGKRVLLVAMIHDSALSIKHLKPGTGRAVGLVVLSNELRDGVRKTVDYLQSGGVSIRVISGDNSATVSYIAKKAGITNHHKILTGAELNDISDDKWDEKVSQTVIFARVLPEQKEKLIETFKRLGNFTGMIGDGINDALAIKKSDLGVAMYAGATATRRVADIVLLDNSFNSLPLGMRLGNRIIQAIEIIAILFFHKIIYGIILLVATLVLGIVYPFEPRHITFMNIFLVTIPTIIWALFVPTPKHRLSPKHFWKDTLQAVSPIAILSGIAITIVYISLRALHPADLYGVSTTTVLVATFFGVYLVFLVPRMFDIKNDLTARLARVVFVLSVLFVVIPSFGLEVARDFFDFTAPAWGDTWQLVIMVVFVAVLQWIIAERIGHKLRQRIH